MVDKVTFTDIDLNFIKHPVSRDITKKYDVDAIKQSVKNLILTNFYERPFHPEIGSQITGLLFENWNPMLEAVIKQAVANTIGNFEPRVKLIDVLVVPNPDNNALRVSIVFKIVNTETPITIEITLQRTR